MAEQDRSAQEAIYSAIADAAEDLHRIVAALAIYPPEVASMVVNAALKGSPIKGKRCRRLQGFMFREVRALREARAAGDHVPFAGNPSAGRTGGEEGKSDAAAGRFLAN